MSAGARTGVSDLVPTLNLTEDDPIVVSDTEDEVAVEATGGEIGGDEGEEEEGVEAQGSGGKADIHDGQGSDEEEKGGGEEEGEETEEEMDTLRGNDTTDSEMLTSTPLKDGEFTPSEIAEIDTCSTCLLYTSPSPRD